MKNSQLVTLLLLMVGLAACTANPIETQANLPTPVESLATPTLAAPVLTPTLEAVTKNPEGSENIVNCDGVAEDGWKVYCNSALGYRFYYPSVASLETDPDRPVDGVTLIGPEVDGERWPWIEVRHPQGLAEYSPTLDVDLQKWLEDHYLLGAPQLADVQIAGTRAVHLRFERSPQSYAFDRYYFARANQLYMILISHTSDREDWDLYNQILESFSFEIDS
jgi:hypothetical protein